MPTTLTIFGIRPEAIKMGPFTAYPGVHLAAIQAAHVILLLVDHQQFQTTPQHTTWRKSGDRLARPTGEA